MDTAKLVRLKVDWRGLLPGLWIVAVQIVALLAIDHPAVYAIQAAALLLLTWMSRHELLAVAKQGLAFIPKRKKERPASRR